MEQQGSDEDTDYEEREREQIMSCCRELSLSKLQAGLCGITAHERCVALIA